MSRCLHVTIHEGSDAAPRRATASLSPRTGNFRESDDAYDPVPDPVPPPVLDNPSSDDGELRLANRGTPPFLSGAPGSGCGAAVETACSCCCATASQDTAAPWKTMPHPFIEPRDYSGFVIVRMASGIESATAQTLWDLAQERTPKLFGLQAVLELPVKAKTKRQIREAQPDKPPPGTLVSKPLVELQKPVCGHEEGATESAEADAGDQPQLSRRQILEAIHDLERRTASTAFPPLHSLTSYWRLDLRQHSTLVKKVVARLRRLAEVGLAYRELAATDPEGAVSGRVFSEDQGYLGNAPIGISASWAREMLPQAPGSTLDKDQEPVPAPSITLCDLEQGWNLDHQDLKDQKIVDPLFGLNRAQHDKEDDKHGKRLGNHGTAVLGQLAATGKNAFGVQGIATDFGRFVLASHYGQDNINGHVSAAIAQAHIPAAPPSPDKLFPLKPGDVLLIEVQRGRLPVEVDEADFNAIRLAAGLGIIVIEAAGNGGFDLDAYSDPNTGRSLRRGDPRFQDSGAILVGAARAGLPHDRASFSNYGSRLDCFGWGEAVTTCGYGDLAGSGPTDSYTNSFSGTSSASPIIAGAAALLQILHQTHTGKRLEPRAMREILADPTTGTRQGPNVPGNIGVLPDLKAIVRDRLRLVPNIYLRRSLGDDGDEISSSPDLLIPSPELNFVSSPFGEGSPAENPAAPGGPVVPGNIYLRLRNRGLGEGKVHVQLFASPVATLITPERWLPVSRPGLDGVGPIPQGDTLFVAGPISWELPVSGPISTEVWSLLAILSEPEASGPPGLPYFDGTGGMPPGPPYFDWAQYRAFLRGPGVAWRNTHHDTAESPTLSFFIAGTPDRARHFDFEVIQRLPAGAKVSFQELPAALDAKLRQRLPWLDAREKPLFLPERPRMAIRGVELAAGTYAKAVFRVQPGSVPFKIGHSLALRQLWRGEEVGRITWYFGPLSK